MSETSLAHSDAYNCLVKLVCSRYLLRLAASPPFLPCSTWIALGASLCLPLALLEVSLSLTYGMQK